MTSEFLLAIFIMAVGLSAAGAITHLYQAVWRAPAEISYAGQSYLASLGNLLISFLCGPYIMLRMGLQPDSSNRVSTMNMLIAALVAFGWAFITGLLLMAVYLAAFTG